MTYGTLIIILVGNFVKHIFSNLIKNYDDASLFKAPLLVFFVKVHAIRVND